MPFAKENDPDDDNDEAEKKHENGYAVDAMHILHPCTVRGIGISLFDVKVFRDLA
jgi:hypothetical protein